MALRVSRGGSRAGSTVRGHSDGGLAANTALPSCGRSPSRTTAQDSHRGGVDAIRESRARTFLHHHGPRPVNGPTLVSHMSPSVVAPGEWIARCRSTRHQVRRRGLDPSGPSQPTPREPGDLCRSGPALRWAAASTCCVVIAGCLASVAQSTVLGPACSSSRLLLVAGRATHALRRGKPIAPKRRGPGCLCLRMLRQHGLTEEGT